MSIIVSVDEFIEIWNSFDSLAPIAERLQTSRAAVAMRAAKFRKLGHELKHKACKIAAPIERRFWSKVNKTDSCWLWTDTPNPKGYGQISRGGRKDGMTLAHRLSWELHNGAIPDGICVLHRCDTPACVRPDHLFLGTVLDNDKDRDDKGRTCKGTDHANAILDSSKVLEIRRRVDAGETKRSIAPDYGVGEGCISQVCRRKTWKHVE